MKTWEKERIESVLTSSITNDVLLYTNLLHVGNGLIC